MQAMHLITKDQMNHWLKYADMHVISNDKLCFHATILSRYSNNNMHIFVACVTGRFSKYVYMSFVLLSILYGLRHANTQHTTYIDYCVYFDNKYNVLCYC
jgi:hypothetical protein